jgi:hypothetical protein
MDRIVKRSALGWLAQPPYEFETHDARDLVPFNGLTCPLSETTKIVKTSCRAAGRANNQSRSKSAGLRERGANGLQDGAGRAAGKVAKVIMNRPDKKNAMNPQLVMDMAQVLEDLRYDGRIAVVVLTGAGNSFCAAWTSRNFFTI